MAFNNYLEDENDKPYFTTNSLAYYYDKMEGFAKAVEGAAKALNLTKEEVEKRLTLYIEQNKNELDQRHAQNKNELDQRHAQNKNELDQRLAQWDGKLETFDSSVETLLSEWVNDGTLTHVIDSTLIDQKIAPVSARFAETDQKIKNTEDKTKTYVSYKQRNVRPIVTIIDDDGRNHVYGKLFPILKGKGVPGNAAIVSGLIDKAFYMTSPQLDELYANGWEFLGHAKDYTYPNMVDVPTDSELEEQLYTGGKKWLTDRGYEVNGFVYPQGKHNLRVRKHVQRHFEYSFSTTDFIKQDFLNSMLLPRLAFGDYTDQNPTINGNSEKNTLAYYKEAVNYTISNNGWLVLMLHVGNYTDATYQMISDLIDYIKSKNVDIVTATEGYRIHGNQLYSGDYIDDNYMIIDRNGVAKLPNSGNLPTKLFGYDAVIPSTPPSYFDDYSISITNIKYSFGSSNAFPENAGGTLTTYRYSSEYPLFTYQEYKLHGFHATYTRYAIDNNTWSTWRYLTSVSTGAAPPTAGTDAPTAYEQGITGFSVGSGHPTQSSFPKGQIGYLMTYKFSGSSSGVYQQYDVRNSTDRYKRYWNSTSNTWTPWGKIGGDRGTSSERPTGVSPGYMYYDTTLNKPIWLISSTTNKWADANGVEVV